MKKIKRIDAKKLNLNLETVREIRVEQLPRVKGGLTGLNCTGTDGPGCNTACFATRCLCTQKATSC